MMCIVIYCVMNTINSSEQIKEITTIRGLEEVLILAFGFQIEVGGGLG